MGEYSNINNLVTLLTFIYRFPNFGLFVRKTDGEHFLEKDEDNRNP